MINSPGNQQFWIIIKKQVARPENLVLKVRQPERATRATNFGNN
jgi:hypothetical protein